MDTPRTRLVAALVCRAIGGYQRWISPRKGFRCAHALLHGGSGCSGAVRELVRTRGVLGALPAINARFAACRAAYLALPALGYSGTQLRGVCCCNGIPIPF